MMTGNTVRVPVETVIVAGSNTPLSFCTLLAAQELRHRIIIQARLIMRWRYALR